MTIEQILARLAEIDKAIDTATGDDLTSLETESRSLCDELENIKAEAKCKQEMRTKIAEGAGTKIPFTAPQAVPQISDAEKRAKELAETRKMNIDAEQARSVLVSSGTLATPTEVAGINDIPGAKYSSIIDMCKVVNCTGMSTYRVAYTATDASEAPTQTEGTNTGLTQALGTFAFVDITPTSVAVIDYISKQTKRQTPLQYATKVHAQALTALRKEAALIATTALKSSTLNTTLNAKVASSKGVVDETTLRKIALAYGGDESVIGGAVLFLNKDDLTAFGDVRGTGDKKAVYEITPDTSNPNTGIIKDGGLSVRYCINSNLTACHNTSQSQSANIVTMLYGNPQCLEIGLFSDYEIKVSEDFAFDKLMDAIRGNVEIGAGVTVKNGFVALTIPKSGS